MSAFQMLKKRSTHLAFIGLSLLLAVSVEANNIQVANPTLTGDNGTAVQVQFDLSWENSWRGGGVHNWDAAWVFVKYRTSATGPWLHANLNYGGHVPAAGSQIEPGLLNPFASYNSSTNPVVGVFVSRDLVGSGNMALPNTQLNWGYAALGLVSNDIFAVKVFAIEMVYVNQGEFAVGSGGSEFVSFPLTTINTTNATTPPGGSGSLGGPASGYPPGQPPPSSPSWPNGYGAFYCMKYEVSQQGYVDFLNTLTYAQQDTRTASVPSNPAGTGALTSSNQNRNGIDIRNTGVNPGSPARYACNGNGNGVYGEADDGTDVACNFLSWGDLTAYLDWSGLRPMTEVEFEKACRGTVAPVPNEHPWGSTDVANAAYTLADAGGTNESIATNYSTTLGNASYDVTDGAINGPLRVGIFATSGGTSRAAAGATYYGIMEMGGNVVERIVTIGNTEGRAYTGTHGNGTLNIGGDPDGVTWPAPTTAQGAGLRGGSFLDSELYARISDRVSATSTVPARNPIAGGRGVRSAP